MTIANSCFKKTVKTPKIIDLTSDQKRMILCVVCEMTRLGLTKKPCQLYYDIKHRILCKQVDTELDFDNELNAIKKCIYSKE